MLHDAPGALHLPAASGVLAATIASDAAFGETGSTTFVTAGSAALGIATSGAAGAAIATLAKARITEREMSSPRMMMIW